MLDNYLDIEKKLKYYKEDILKQFIAKGIYPDNKLIANYINDIDLNLSIFKNYNKVAGNKFDTNEYNKSMSMIYEDIKILYHMLEELTIKEYNNLQNYINSYINELNSLVDTYKKRADYENNSTTLGETLLFQNNNFTITNENSTTIIKLSPIELEDASTIACIANINTLNKNSDVVFNFKNNEREFNITPYNINNATYKIPGEKKINTFDYALSNDQHTEGSVLLNTNSAINIKNNYKILSGKDKFFINNKESNNYSIQNAPINSGVYLFTENSYVNFYLLDGNSITFKFNKKPISANFPLEEPTIKNLNKIHHFYFECDKDFYFEIEIDKGTIYAINEDGIVNNNNLYYTGPNIVKDFHIIETCNEDAKTYDAQLKIFNDNKNNTELDNIVIKKIN